MLTNRHTLPIAARDFETIQQSLLDFVKTAYDGDVDEVSMHALMGLNIDMVATVGDAYYREAERAAGGSSLASTVEPQRVLDIAYFDYGYVPEGAIAAEYTQEFIADVNVAFLLHRGDKLRTIPADGSPAVVFELKEDVLKPLGSTSVTATIQHGETLYQTTNASGAASDSVLLNSSRVVLDTVKVLVEGVEWERVTTWALSTPTSQHYRIIATETLPDERRYRILFGDGSLGALPTTNALVEIEFLAGGGHTGNVSLNTITRLVELPQDGQGDAIPVTTSNTAQTVRGQDMESVDVVRIKAPMMATLHGGVVSLRDYEAASLLEGAARARAYTRTELPGLAPNIVIVYIILDLDDVATTPELDALKDAIETTYRHNGTASLKLVPAQFKDFILDVDVYAAAGFDKDDLLVEVNATLTDFLSLGSVIGPVPHFVLDIGYPVSLSNIVAVLESIDGVDHVELPTHTDPFGQLVPGVNELPRVTVRPLVL